MALAGKNRSKVRNLVPKSSSEVDSETQELLSKSEQRIAEIMAAQKNPEVVVETETPQPQPNPEPKREKAAKAPNLMNEPSYNLPAIRGVQGDEAYYAVNIPLRLLSKLLPPTDESVPADVRAQRSLNNTRVKKLTTYLLNNTSDFTLPALTISMKYVDTRERFVAANEDTPDVGTLNIPMDMQFMVNDGQHRRAAVIEALKENSELNHNTIPAMLFLHKDMSTERKRFHVLNAYTSKPAASINKLYDEDNRRIQLAKDIMKQVENLNGAIELEKGSISGKSNKLWAFVNYGRAVELACDHVDSKTLKEDLSHFFDVVTTNVKPIYLHSQMGITGADLRNDFVVAHGVFCESLGVVFNFLYRNRGSKWKVNLNKLGTINWKRVNKLWNLRCVVGGKMKKTTKNIKYTATGILVGMGEKLEGELRMMEMDYQSELEELPK